MTHRLTVQSNRELKAYLDIFSTIKKPGRLNSILAGAKVLKKCPSLDIQWLKEQLKNRTNLS